MINNTLSKYDFGNECVCVGRVSTSGQSTTAQCRDLEDFAQQLGYKTIQTFQTTESGFIEYGDKQGWNLVVDFFSKNPTCKIMIVSELNRLSRKESILFKIKDYLIDNKIQLIIKDINFSLFDEWGNIPKGNDIVFALYASLADSEMRQKKERFKRALKDYKLQGYCIGGKVLFGYVRKYKSLNGKERSYYEVNEKEANEIRQIYDWYVYGINGDLTKTSILAITNECIARGFSRYLHSKRNVNKCLKEEAYCGQKETHNRVQNPEYWNYKKLNEPKYVKGESYICTYPPIFKGEAMSTFLRVKERLIENNTRCSGNSPIDRGRKHTTILARLVRCPGCGRFLCGEYRKRNNSTVSYSYRCNNSRGVVHLCPHTSLISMRVLDSVVWGYCKNEALRAIKQEEESFYLNRKEEIQNMLQNLHKRIEEFNYEEKAKEERKILRTIVTISRSEEERADAFKEYEARMKGYQKELDNYTKKIQELNSELDSIKLIIASDNDINESIIWNKKTLYEHIHKLVEQIDIVATHRDYTLVKIHIKGRNMADFVYIYKRDPLRVKAYKISSYNGNLMAYCREQLKMFDTLDGRCYLAKYLPNRPSIDWNAETNSLIIEDKAISIDTILNDYRLNDVQEVGEENNIGNNYTRYNRKILYEFITHTLPSVDAIPNVEYTDVPHIFIEDMKFDILNCYEEDLR
jgi:DNA invertase Pin-like site-specific DNA recombinase